MSKGRECRNTRRSIDESIPGQLSRQAQTHIARCDDCRAFQAERARLLDLVGGLHPITAPADFDLRLRARLRASPVQGAWFAPWRPSFRNRASVMVVIIVAVLGVVWFAASPSHFGTSPDVAQRNRVDNPAANDVLAPAKDRGPAGSAEINAPGSPRDERDIKRAKGFYQDDSTKHLAPTKRGNSRATMARINRPVTPLILSLQDREGVTYTLSLPPVTFGSQQLVKAGPGLRGNPAADRTW